MAKVNIMLGNNKYANGVKLDELCFYRRSGSRRGGGVPLILSLASGDFCVSILHIMPAYSSFQEEWSFGEFGKDFVKKLSH